MNKIPWRVDVMIKATIEVMAESRDDVQAVVDTLKLDIADGEESVLVCSDEFFIDYCDPVDNRDGDIDD